MKPWQYITTLALGGACLLCVITLIILGNQSRSRSETLQEKARELAVSRQQTQAALSEGQTAQQIGVNLLRDMGAAAIKNDSMVALLKQHNLAITTNTPTTPTGAAPATTPR